MLVSADYLASDYIYSEEMPRLMQKADTGTAVVLPVIVRPVDWMQAPFGTLQALPKDGTPVALWSNRDAAWASVVEGLMSALDRLPPHNETEFARRGARRSAPCVDTRYEPYPSVAMRSPRVRRQRQPRDVPEKERRRAG